MMNPFEAMIWHFVSMYLTWMQAIVDALRAIVASL